MLILTFFKPYPVAIKEDTKTESLVKTEAEKNENDDDDKPLITLRSPKDVLMGKKDKTKEKPAKVCELIIFGFQVYLATLLAKTENLSVLFSYIPKFFNHN